MTKFTLKEKLVDRMTGGALTAWYNAVEEAISHVDEKFIVGDVFIWIYDTSWLEDKKLLKQVSFKIEKGDEGEGTITDVNYYSSMPYLDYKDEAEESKHDLLFDSLKELLKREGLNLDLEGYLDKCDALLVTLIK